jgi:hypothetical protein
MEKICALLADQTVGQKIKKSQLSWGREKNNLTQKKKRKNFPFRDEYPLDSLQIPQWHAEQSP